VKLSNGREYTYKALVVASGFSHKASNIEGLTDFEKDRGENKVWVHAVDNKERVDRNFYHGWNHTNGDMICYAP
jgi:NADH dehydrogenase FAD-containing subunit